MTLGPSVDLVVGDLVVGGAIGGGSVVVIGLNGVVEFIVGAVGCGLVDGLVGRLVGGMAGGVVGCVLMYELLGIVGC